MKNTIANIMDTLNKADALLITAGAGMGSDSGLPTFRDNDGFWKEFPELEADKIKFSDIATPDFFHVDPHLAWAFYGWRYHMYQQIQPHLGYKQLLNIANSKKEGYFVYTSNIDGHFHRAGYDLNKVVECHGSITHFQCNNPECHQVWRDEEFFFAVDETCMELLSEPPMCPKCEMIARPNVLMFEDHAWNEDRLKNQTKRLKAWLKTLINNNSQLAIIELGAGQSIPTVRLYGETIATQHNAPLIRINADENDCVSADYHMHQTAKESIALLR